MPATRSDAIIPALEALAVLEALGETVEEDWQYVVDLARAWRLNLENIASDDPVTDEQVGAIAAAAAEATLISDAHRAIDWLSTLPQLVVVALAAA